MAHHLLNIKNFDFVDRFENCILIRDPKKVIASYTLKNNLLNAKELGYHQQNEIINYLIQKKKNYCNRCTIFTRKPRENSKQVV